MGRTERHGFYNPQIRNMREQDFYLYLRKHGFGAFTPKAVLFDMDGVLFDSMPNHAKSWAEVCSEFGLHITPEEAYLHEGRTGASTINLLMRREYGRDATEKEIRDIYEAKCEAFNACPEAPKMSGAEELLSLVRDSGLKIGVVTGSGQKSLLDRLEHNFPGFFTPELIVSSKDVTHGKPNPEPYLKGMEKAGVNPWETIVIENAPLGVEAASRARAFTVAANTGPLPDSALYESGADLLFPSMQAVADAWPLVEGTIVRDSADTAVCGRQNPMEAVAERRPEVLECDVVRFQNNKEKWVAFVGLLEGRPYEIFTGLQDDDEGIVLPKTVTKGRIIKYTSADGAKRYDFQFENKRGYKTTVEGLSEKFNKEYWNYAKLISGVLRYRMPIANVVRLVDSLQLDSENINSWKAGVARALKKYVGGIADDASEAQ